MSKTIELKGKTVIDNGSKEKEWVAIGKKYKADILEVLDEDNEYPADCIQVTEEYAYSLRWKIEEDDIWVFGEKNYKTTIQVDEAIYKKESIVKLEKAVMCFKEIEANKKKYY